jgi:uncharacterized protein (UPF0332 family)
VKKISERLLAKADQACSTAAALVSLKDYEAAVNRAYYAMFHAAQALLHEKGLSFGKHSAVQSAFGLHFAKSGLLDPQYHRWMLIAFDLRTVADYGVEVGITKEDADLTLTHANLFLDAAREYLAQEPTQ